MTLIRRANEFIATSVVIAGVLFFGFIATIRGLAHGDSDWEFDE